MADLSPEFMAFMQAEGDRLLNDAIEMAIKLIEKNESCIPFGVVILAGGEREFVVPDDRVTSDRQILADTVMKALTDGFSCLKFRSVAFVRNVVVANDSPQKTAIQITIEQIVGRHITCYLPYTLENGKFIPDNLYATNPVEKFLPAAPNAPR